jgi:hypothetical protein
VLAAHGLAALALTPSPCEMIGQEPPLAEQGLVLATEPVEWLRNDAAFDLFARRTAAIREGRWCLSDQMFCRIDDGTTLIFPHQVAALGGHGLKHHWRLKWSQAFGPFAAVADYSGIENAEHPHVSVPLAGPCTFFVSGGETGGKVRLVDTHSGYEIELELAPEGEARQVMQLAVPGNVAWRPVTLTALTPGVRFYGIKVSEPQPVDPAFAFEHGELPKP